MAFYHVSFTGNDTTGDGSLGAPWKTLTKACTVAVGGDTIYIRDVGGVYSILAEQSFKPVGSAGNLITITNYPGESPVFDGTGGTFGSSSNILVAASGSQYADIGGFTVRNNAQGSALGRGMSVSSSVGAGRANHLTFRDIIVHDIYKRGFGIAGDFIELINIEVYNAVLENEFEAFGGGGGWAAAISTVAMSDGTAPTNVTITSCNVHEVWGEGYIIWDCDTATVSLCRGTNCYSVTFYTDESIHVTYDRNLAVFNNSAYQRQGRNTDGFTWAAEATGTPNMDWSPANIRDLTYKNNIVQGCRYDYRYFHATGNTSVRNTYQDVKIYFGSGYGSSISGFAIDDVDGAHTQPSGGILRNAILYGTLTIADASGWTFSNCNCVGGIPGTGTWTNCISANPLYSSPNTTGDIEGMKLQATSPCINTGIAVAGITTDREGNTRSDPPEMGAFEFIAVPAVRGKATVISF